MKQIEDLIDLLNEFDKPVDEDERVYSEYSWNFLRGEREDMEKHNLSLWEYVEWVLAWEIHKGTLYYRSIWGKQHRQIDDTKLTPSQERVYNYYKKNSWASYSDASKSIGIATTVIFNSVKILERKWYIRKDNWKVLVIK